MLKWLYFDNLIPWLASATCTIIATEPNPPMSIKSLTNSWALIWGYSVRAIKWLPTWQGLDGFQKCFYVLELWAKVASALEGLPHSWRYGQIWLYNLCDISKIEAHFLKIFLHKKSPNIIWIPALFISSFHNQILLIQRTIWGWVCKHEGQSQSRRHR